MKVRGRWAYLYRAVDKFGNTIDFYLSPTRNTKAAKRFLSKRLNGLKDWDKPRVINTDKAPTYAAALAELKKEGKCPKDTQHRQVKYLNNVVEADHGKLKQLIRPVRGFKSKVACGCRLWENVRTHCQDATTELKTQSRRIFDTRAACCLNSILRADSAQNGFRTASVASGHATGIDPASN